MSDRRFVSPRRAAELTTVHTWVYPLVLEVSLGYRMLNLCPLVDEHVYCNVLHVVTDICASPWLFSLILVTPCRTETNSRHLKVHKLSYWQTLWQTVCRPRGNSKHSPVFSLTVSARNQNMLSCEATNRHSAETTHPRQHKYLNTNTLQRDHFKNNGLSHMQGCYRWDPMRNLFQQASNKNGKICHLQSAIKKTRCDHIKQQTHSLR